jgi:hypothetical protein
MTGHISSCLLGFARGLSQTYVHCNLAHRIGWAERFGEAQHGGGTAALSVKPEDDTFVLIGGVGGRLNSRGSNGC